MGFDPTFIASGAGHRAGSVPDPGSTSGISRFLGEDSQWRVPFTFSVTNAGGGSTIDFPSISQGATHLLFYGLVRSATASGATVNPGNPVVAWSLTLNGITAGYVFSEQLQDATGTLTGFGNTGQSAISLGGLETGGVAGYGGLAADTDRGHWLSFSLLIPHYTNDIAYKALHARMDGAGAASQNTVLVAASAQDSSFKSNPITQVTFHAASGSFHGSSLVQMLGIS